MARSISYIMSSICEVPQFAEAGPPPLSLIAKASKALKRGASIDPPGYDAEKIKGGKDTYSSIRKACSISPIVHAADIEDRDGGAFVMATMFGMYPLPDEDYAMSGTERHSFRRADKDDMARVNVEIVKRSDHAKGLSSSPKQWVVERTFAWLGRVGVSPKFGKYKSQGARISAPRFDPRASARKTIPIHMIRTKF